MKHAHTWPYKHVLMTLSLALLAACQSLPPAPPLRQPIHLTDAIKQQLDAAIEKHMADNNLPSVAVSIVVPGELPYTFVKGKANLADGATGADRQLDQPVRIASNTKTFVGLTILTLVDQGKLSVNDKIAKWFLDFPNADIITVDDLLRMRSGIPDPFDSAWLAKYYADPLMSQSAEESIKLAAARVNDFTPPNQITKYVNVNFNLLQVIAEKVSEKPIQTLIAETIQPLGLTSTFWPMDNELPGGLRGYSWNAATSMFEDKTILNPQAPGGAGAMISNIRDLQTYVRALCTGVLLKPETHATQLQAQPLSGSPSFVQYGEGLGLFGKFCGHTGTIAGFSTDMFYLPELDATVITSVNRLDLDDHSHSTPLTLVVTKIALPQYVNW